MTFEAWLTWLIVGFLAVVFTFRLISAQTTGFQEKQVLQFWQRVGLPMGSERINATLRRRLRRSTNASLLGGVVGAAVAAAILYFTAGSLLSFTFPWQVAIPAIFIGATAVDVAVALKDTFFGQPVDGPRMARVVAVSVADYISPWRLTTAPVLLGLAALLTGSGVVLAATGTLDSSSYVLAMALPLFIVAVAVLALCGLAARRVLAQPQPVADSLELAWSDALRADILRKQCLLCAVLAWLALSSAGLAILTALTPSPVGGPESMTVVVGQITAMWGYFAVLFVYNFGTSSSYFRYRLWSSPDSALRPDPDTGLPSATGGV